MQKSELLRNDQLNFGSARDLVAIVFRKKRIIVLAFLVFAALGIFWALTFPKYESEMEILVRRDRVDPMVTAQSSAPAMYDRGEITEEDLNSEVELLKSQDLLRLVVTKLGLQNSEHLFFAGNGDQEERKIAKAVKKLSKQIVVKPVQKTALLTVSYRSSDPAKAHRVLETLAQLYLEKHIKVHRPSGQFTFFDAQADHYGEELRQAEDKLTQFTRDEDVVSASQERDIALQHLSEFELAADKTKSEIAETSKRLHALEALRQAVPERIATLEKKSDNPQLLEFMKSTLLTMELKREDMAGKYAADYRPLVDLEQQIAQTRQAIASEGSKPVREHSDDRNPSYEWLSSELMKSRTDLSGLQARQTQEAAMVTASRDSAKRLQELGVNQDELIRDVKVKEDDYLMYVRKREESRINDALDRTGILNVALAEEPFTPVLPSPSSSLLVLLGLFGAAAASVSMGAVLDMCDSTVRSRDELEECIGVPVLAAIPKTRVPYEIITMRPKTTNSRAV